MIFYRYEILILTSVMKIALNVFHVNFYVLILDTYQYPGEH